MIALRFEHRENLPVGNNLLMRLFVCSRDKQRFFFFLLDMPGIRREQGD